MDNITLATVGVVINRVATEPLDAVNAETAANPPEDKALAPRGAAENAVIEAFVVKLAKTPKI